jgi:hypothetical protein
VVAYHVDGMGEGLLHTTLIPALPAAQQAPDIQAWSVEGMGEGWLSNQFERERSMPERKPVMAYHSDGQGEGLLGGSGH